MSRMIDPYATVPKYYQLASILQQEIDKGKWQPRSPIPSERQLEIIYNVSRTTIREAIDHLIRQGYLYREHGRGTFVSPPKLQKGLMELTSFSEDLVKRGIHPGQIIRDISTVVPPSSILQKLELPPGTPMLRLERIRLGNDIPIGIQTSYLILDEGQTITRADLEEMGSLYRILQEKLHIIPSEADETLEVTTATKIEADLLQIQEGAPLLLSERVLFAQNRRPVEYVKILYRGDRYRYYVRLTK